MKAIIPPFKESLFDSTLRDAIINTAEVGIDSCLDDGLFKSIPIVGTLIGIAKTGQHIHDRNLLKQTFGFVKAFNDKKISQDKLKKYRKQIESNPLKAENELGRVIVILNYNVDLQKSRFLGKIYANYIDEQINWDEFCELSDVINRLFLSDYELLVKIYDNEVISTKYCESYKAERLSSIGLISLLQNEMVIKAGTNGVPDTSNSVKIINITSLGKKFIKFSNDS